MKFARFIIFFQNNNEHIVFRVKRQGSGLSYFHPVGPIPVESWVHLTMTWTVEKGSTVYKNGCFHSQRQELGSASHQPSSNTISTIWFAKNSTVVLKADQKNVHCPGKSTEMHRHLDIKSTFVCSN